MLHWKPNKIFFRRSHKVALVGGVTSALMPLLLTALSMLTSKPYLGICLMFIYSNLAAIIKHI